MKYSELYKNSIEELKSVGILDAESDVRLLFYYLLDIDRGFLLSHGEDEVDSESVAQIANALSVRKKRVPLQHITGKQNFMGLEFNVTKDVLVPRFDTENLVEEAMLVTADGDRVLDVCTGSGCILISLMQYKNDIQGYGCDISEAALNIAKKNASELCKPNDNPVFIKSDLFSDVEIRDFDVIISNPPYIKSDVIGTLMPEVKDYDPIIALDGGADGLDFYRRIVSDARSFLRSGGRLLVEIGHDQGEEVKELFLQNGYSDVKVKKDLGSNDRVVSGRYICLTD